MNTAILAWHLVGAKLRDGRPVPPDGEWLAHAGPIQICEAGLHASERLLDALQYAPGSMICRVELERDVVREDDKLVGRRRRILWRIDGEELLRRFARECACSVLHLWDAPDVVRAYLESGDESLREATWGAVRDAVRAAARGAARAAARGAARGAARDTGWEAARDAAWGATWVAARDAACGAAWDAAWGAARATGWEAARGAAWAAVRDAQNESLTNMVEAAHLAQGGQ